MNFNCDNFGPRKFGCDELDCEGIGFWGEG